MNYTLLDPFNIGFPDHIKSNIVIEGAIKLKYNRLGTYLAIGNDQGEIQILSTDVNTNIKTLKSEVKGYVSSICFSHDNQFLAFGTREGIVKIFDVIEEKEIFSTDVGQAIIQVEFVPGRGNLLVIITRGLFPILIDTNDDPISKTFLKPESEKIQDVESQRWCDQLNDFTCCSIDRLGMFLLLATMKGFLAVYHFPSKNFIHIERNSRTAIKQIQFNKDLSEVLINCRNHIKVVKFNFMLENEIPKISFNYPTKYQSHNEGGEWNHSSFDNTGDYVIGVFDRDKDHRIHIWEKMGASLHSLLVGPSHKNSIILDLQWHPKAPTLISLGSEGKVFFWEPTYSQKWSGFSSKFSELSQNLVYKEPEDAYDLPYAHPSHQRHNKNETNELKHSGNRLKSEEEDDIIVDVCSIDNPFTFIINKDLKVYLDQISYDESYEKPLFCKPEPISSPEIENTINNGPPPNHDTNNNLNLNESKVELPVFSPSPPPVPSEIKNEVIKEGTTDLAPTPLINDKEEESKYTINTETIKEEEIQPRTNKDKEESESNNNSQRNLSPIRDYDERDYYRNQSYYNDRRDYNYYPRTSRPRRERYDNYYDDYRYPPSYRYSNSYHHDPRYKSHYRNHSIENEYYDEYYNNYDYEREYPRKYGILTKDPYNDRYHQPRDDRSYYDSRNPSDYYSRQEYYDRRERRERRIVDEDREFIKQQDNKTLEKEEDSETDDPNLEKGEIKEDDLNEQDLEIKENKVNHLEEHILENNQQIQENVKNQIESDENKESNISTSSSQLKRPTSNMFIIKNKKIHSNNSINNLNNNNNLVIPSKAVQEAFEDGEIEEGEIEE